MLLHSVSGAGKNTGVSREKKEMVAKVEEMSGFTLPETAILELTYACNHECKFCSCPWENTVNSHLYFGKYREMTADGWKEALHVLYDCGVKQVTISGGEPLLKDGFGEILQYIRRSTKLNAGQRISVITNGAAMSEAFLSLFKDAGVHLSFSLPGLKTFAYHTGSKENTAANVLHWIRRAKEESLSVNINVTVTKENIHELFEIIANGLIAGAGSLLLNRFIPGGRGMEHQKELSLSREQITLMLDIAEKTLDMAGIDGFLGIEVPLCIIEDEGKYKRMSIGGLCAGASRFFAVDPSGYVRVCNHSPRRLGHIFDKRIISNVEYWHMFSGRNFKLPEMCDGCEERHRCDCGCREAAAICNGDLSSPDPCFGGQGDGSRVPH